MKNDVNEKGARSPRPSGQGVRPALDVDEVIGFLAESAKAHEPVAGDVPSDLVRHGLECAELLRGSHPQDLELQIAGLLHDVGLLLVPGDELGHPRHGADYVRGLFGERCATLIGLHVDAQRYLEMTAEGYTVTPPPTAGFAEQPGPMTADERAAFEAHPLFRDALELRGADDHSDDHSGPSPDPESWRACMEEVASRNAAP